MPSGQCMLQWPDKWLDRRFSVMQKIDAEEQAIWEEMLSAADMVEEEARQRYRKSKESKEVSCM